MCGPQGRAAEFKLVRQHQVPHPFRITISASGTNEAEELAGEFSDSEWNQLSRFLTASLRLAACRIVETQSQIHFGIRGEGGMPTVHEVSLPPESDIAEFLLRMRPFLLQDEDMYFHKVRNTLAKHLTLPRARAYLDSLKDRFQAKHMPFQLEVGSTAGQAVVNSPPLVLKWLNAFEYHFDEEKQDELRAMYAVFPEPSMRAMFLFTLLESAAAIGKLGAMIDGLSKRDGRQLTSRV